MDTWPVIRDVPDSVEWAGLLLWALVGAAVGSVSRNASYWLLLVVGTTSGPLVLEWLLMRHALWVPGVAPSVAALIGALIGLALNVQRESAQRKMIWRLFSQHVSPEVAGEILRRKSEMLEGGRVISKTVTATVLFSDLKDFTPTCEAHSPEWVMSWLGRHTERMTDIVMAHGGVVDDYFGDAIKANFGVPLSSSDPARIRESALAAVACALEMREALQPLNKELVAGGKQRIQMRIGIETGALVSGILGSRNRQKYTTVGDTVNTAARLQTVGVSVAEAKARDCTIVIGPETERLIEGHHKLLPAGQVRVKGKSEVLDAWYL
jgi:class 3 adenylate cyclase